ncbi:MAG: hypothetical protein BGN96_04865 [Bacteroidales bacterium 45-6]|nr:MAG: hypothetical protein BGN96_04865 [Bacteroidales bacterium 45-6]
MDIKITITGIALLLCTMVAGQTTLLDGKFVFTMHQQTRTYQVKVVEKGDSVYADWKTYYNFHWLAGRYAMEKASLKNGDALSWLQPIDGKVENLKKNETFGFISRKALADLRTKGYFLYNQTVYRLNTQSPPKETFGGIPLLAVVADVAATEMWIVDNDGLPVIVRLSNNPLGIDWVVSDR